jgi:hypothetical protein
MQFIPLKDLVPFYALVFQALDLKWDTMFVAVTRFLCFEYTVLIFHMFQLRDNAFSLVIIS